MLDLRKAVVTAAAFICLGACGGDDDGGEAAPAGSEAEATSATVVASPGQGSTGASATTAAATQPAGGGGSFPTCALAAEDVSDVMGIDMEDIGACLFESSGTGVPAGFSYSPTVGYVRQLSLACTSEDVRKEVGYTDEVDGLGDSAYSQQGGGQAMVLVCADGGAFEVTVDSGKDEDASLAAARSLAERVLAAS